MESKKINQLATELAPELSDLTIIGDPTTGISKKITLSQMASLFTGTVEEYPNLASFPLVGTADTIYIALDTNIIYRWNTGTSAYVELSPNIVTSLVFNDANGFDGTISLVGSTATLTITTALTQGSIGFIGASGALTQDNSNFFWDNTNKRLGINTNAPTTAIDAFGSGIIGRLNGTSTNNAFLGFASAGSNKWSIGNVQSDHRFRIYSEANAAELVSVLQTGEVGIGIANPLTKLHIFGGASALIANLDANTSVAKSISFRSGNSSRINLEVSGTESGSNAGANFFIRTYTDAGSLLATPLTITRSTGAIALTGALSGTTATFSSGNTSPSLVAIGSNNGNGLIQISGSSNYQIGAGTDYGGISFTVGGSQKLFIANNGNTIINGTNSVGKFGVKLATATSVSTIAASGWDSTYAIIGNPEVTTGTSFGIGTNNSVAGINLLAIAPASDWVDFNYYSRNHIFYGSGTERFRITTTGQVGIGVTPNTWGSTYKAMQIGASMSLLQDGSSVSSYWGGNLYVGTDNNYKYTINGTAGLLGQEGNSLVFYNASSGTSGNTASITERFRVASNGGLSTNGPYIALDGAGVNSPSGFGYGLFPYAGFGLGLYSTAGSIGFWTSGTPVERMRLNTTQLHPVNDNAMSLGASGIRWSAVWAANGTIQTSDEREKKDIVECDLGLDFISKLRPVSFKWKVGKNEVTSETIIDENGKEQYKQIVKPIEGKRIHYGLIAQEVEELLNGKDFGGFIHDKETDIKGLRYDQFVPLLIKAIQELNAKIK